MQCISTGLRICRYSSYGVGLLLGIPGIDYVFEMNGHIRPLRGFYLKRHIQFFGANEVNCALSEGKKMSQTGLVSNSLGVLQEYTENRERIANTAFNIARNNNVTNITEAVVEALSK